MLACVSTVNSLIWPVYLLSNPLNCDVQCYLHNSVNVSFIVFPKNIVHSETGASEPNTATATSTTFIEKQQEKHPLTQGYRFSLCHSDSLLLPDPIGFILICFLSLSLSLSLSCLTPGGVTVVVCLGTTLAPLLSSACIIYISD